MFYLESPMASWYRHERALADDAMHAFISQILYVCKL